MQVSEVQAADWIYAAAFAARSDAVYLAGHSGRVVLVDENGTGVRVYDIGAVPRRIADTGDYLYLLTDTRLYVLRDDALHDRSSTRSKAETSWSRRPVSGYWKRSAFAGSPRVGAV